MEKRYVALISCAVLFALQGNSAWAQRLPPFTPERPGEDRREQLPQIPLKKPLPLPELTPPPPLGPKAPSLSTQLQVLVKKIKLTGNRVISNEELGKVAAPYENRTLSSEDLQSLRQALTVYYIDKGYVNSSLSGFKKHHEMPWRCQRRNLKAMYASYVRCCHMAGSRRA